MRFIVALICVALIATFAAASSTSAAIRCMNQCPKGMMCAAVCRPYIEAAIEEESDKKLWEKLDNIIGKANNIRKVLQGEEVEADKVNWEKVAGVIKKADKIRKVIKGTEQESDISFKMPRCNCIRAPCPCAETESDLDLKQEFRNIGNAIKKFFKKEQVESDLTADEIIAAAEKYRKYKKEIKNLKVNKCEVCELVVKAIKIYGPKILTPEKTQQVCAPFGKYSELCVKLVNELVKVVEEKSDPKKVCSFYKLC